MSKIEELESKIRHHNRKYYDEDSPEISDVEYDKLKKELQNLCPDSSVFDEIGNATFGQKVQHSSIVPSLPKCHSAEEIMAKFKGKRVVFMPKIDGLSLTLRYSGGNLICAATRGDGFVGENVTANVLAGIKTVPRNVTYKGDLEVRGEVYINPKDFYGNMDQPGYAGLKDGFANPRNAAAGSVRQKNPMETAGRNLKFVGYKVLGVKEVTTQVEAMEFLKSQGFQMCLYGEVDMVCKVEVIQGIIDRHKLEASHFPYETDGIVIVLDSYTEYADAGIAGKYPKGGLAFKFETEKAKALVTGVEWTTSRTGRVVPVANIEPTEICGSVVSRLTLNNFEWYSQNQFDVGDTILFEKANEIIPKLVKVLDTKGNMAAVPTECPSCGTILERDGVDLVCNGESCPAQFLKLVRHILVKLDIKGIADSTIAALEEKGFLKEPWDIFKISEDKLVAAGFGKSESKNWVKAVTGITAEPKQVLACMGIPSWGERMFDMMFSQAGQDPKKWIVAILDGDEESVCSWMLACKGVGQAKHDMFKNGMGRGKEILSHILEHVDIEYKEKPTGGSLGGKSFCITGTLSKSRGQIQDDISNAGGTVKSSVAKGLDYLVAGEDCGSKLDKAGKLGVKVISEQELYGMIGG